MEKIFKGRAVIPTATAQEKAGRTASVARRTFLGASVAFFASQIVTAAAGRRNPRILLRSSWQVVNIGDIAHTPGVLALLERYLPEAEVVLWASPSLSPEVAAMEHRRFPNLKIVKGKIDQSGKASNAELGKAIDRADFLLHGSGPYLVADKDVAAFVAHTKKPFGVYGITYRGNRGLETELLSQAKFVFFRDSVSLEKAKRDGVCSPVMQFGPDGAFAVDLRDDESAVSFLKQNGLEPKKFLCCIPRFRYTPYWRLKGGRKRDDFAVKHARNEAMKEHDHAPLRAAITEVVRQSDTKVLICPEDMTQMRIGREMLFARLPADVKKRVVLRTRYWMTDEAVSTYVRSAGLFGLEMHSPIMCIGNGIPALVGRFEEQTSKGFMWQDIGLGEWLFDMDRPEQVAKLTPAVMSLIQNPQAAQEKVKQAQNFIIRKQQETMSILAKSIPG